MLAAILLRPATLDAQYYFFNDRYYDQPVVFEMGLSGGVMNSFTDLGGKKGAAAIRFSSLEGLRGVGTGAPRRLLLSVRCGCSLVPCCR